MSMTIIVIVTKTVTNNFCHFLNMRQDFLCVSFFKVYDNSCHCIKNVDNTTSLIDGSGGWCANSFSCQIQLS